MNEKHNEIKDNEIRIISACEPEIPKKNNRRVWLISAVAAIIALLAAGIFFFRSKEAEDEEMPVEIPETITEAPSPVMKEEIAGDTKVFIAVIDTTVNNNELLILRPENARPRLVIGTESLADPNIILATQAADVRGDNGEIAGAFVLNGELISKGEAKAGFCSIINGELSIGIADATPMLEQTLTEDGYFFRQYPLVVGGQIVENKPKGKAIRKALAEIAGEMCVVMSKGRLTFHDFSQLLIDVGVRNAIYLVGSSSYGFYVDDKDERVLTGKFPGDEWENVNFIIWEQG